jgi:catechol 2,3-dioxygenase-like lactoylglutathione lyase family enzyme
MPGLVPELICSDIEASLAFYRLLGFQVRYERPQERFAYLECGEAELMLEQPLSQDRLYPHAELVYPYGRGINLTIGVEDVDQVHAALLAAGRELFLPLEERWYERTADAVGMRQLAVQDPDGYLLRISQHLGTHPQ